MRLLNTTTFEFHWVDDPLSIDYAILSHVWKGLEQTYQDLLRIPAHANQKGDAILLDEVSEKIRRCCAYALADGYEWVWIDSCCIDKTSSAELSEAINSMFKWYTCASQCYTYLHDVDDADDLRRKDSQFRASEWFKRGWTLQELIAPSTVIFLTKNWKSIGTKHTLAAVIHQITKIDIGILKNTESLEAVSVARRMSWASRRITTRVEDEAYSLMGLFDIHMPAVYGEGNRAFLRLQEEILKRFPDDSLFAWGDALVLDNEKKLSLLNTKMSPDYHGRLFAPSPRSFESCGEVWPIAQDKLLGELHLAHTEYLQTPPPDYSVTRYGVEAIIPTLTVPSQFVFARGGLKLGFLLCEDNSHHLLALLLRPASAYTSKPITPPGPVRSYLVGSSCATSTSLPDNYRLVKVAGSLLRGLMESWHMPLSFEKIHMPRGGPPVRLNPRWTVNAQTHPQPHAGRCSVFMPSWRTTALAARGVTVQKLVMDRPALSASPWCARRHIFILRHPGGTIRIVVGFCEHCTPAEVVDTQVGSLRIQVQSCPTREIPPTTPASLWFTDHQISHDSLDHVRYWYRKKGSGTARMEFTLRRSQTAAQIMRLSVTFPDSPRDLVLMLDVDCYIAEIEERSLRNAGSMRTAGSSMRTAGTVRSTSAVTSIRNAGSDAGSLRDKRDSTRHGVEASHQDEDESEDEDEDEDEDESEEEDEDEGDENALGTEEPREEGSDREAARLRKGKGKQVMFAKDEDDETVSDYQTARDNLEDTVGT